MTFGAGADDPPTTVALRLEFQRDRLSQQSPEEVLYFMNQYMCIYDLSCSGLNTGFDADAPMARECYRYSAARLHDQEVATQ